MAKKKRVPLNRLVTSETFDSVKELAVVLECSEGEVVDQAVTLLEGSLVGGNGAGEPVEVATSENAAPVDTAELRRIAAGESLANAMPAAVAPPVRETSSERAQRLEREREATLRGRSSVGDDPSVSFDREFVQE